MFEQASPRKPERAQCVGVHCTRRTAMTDQPHDPKIPEPPEVRTAIDADDVKKLKRNPSDEDGKLDVALDESFPTSDAPSNTQPGKGKDPAPSSGYDEEKEKKLAAQH
jgi:hypothetical protein